LQAAIDKAPPGGEVQIVDPAGNYGGASITKSITVSAVAGGATIGAVTINQPGATVVLRGLLLQGRSATRDGLAIQAAGAVHIVRCEIQGFPGRGVVIASNNSKVFVSDTIVRNNGNDGLLNVGGNAGLQLTIDNSRFEDNADDGISTGSGETAISRVVTSGNGANGISTFGSARAHVTSTTSANNRFNGYLITSEVTLDSSVVRGNGLVGLLVQQNSTARISNSVVTNNGTGLQNLNSTLLSRGNNLVSGNGANVMGPVTPLPGI
jgi:hypothetical protein